MDRRIEVEFDIKCRDRWGRGRLFTPSGVMQVELTPPAKGPGGEDSLSSLPTRTGTKLRLLIHHIPRLWRNTQQLPIQSAPEAIFENGREEKKKQYSVL